MNDERDTAETGSPQREGGDPPPAVPDADLGESRTVAARSGADTDFPERPLPADPVEPSPPEGDGGEEAGGEGTQAPEPDMGPSS
ncbi:hypothetical protein [Planobispora longispora]|uniref:Uncharacterized protein n=1 Tax=Planobispora longispora TaxID=28887 RepID=A0A8J3W567_9ACTN|nr:hypothetical protein [Planobispora longispora]BFE81732.1 hypothetical protein GCM10020093_043330 [Planobispora longispora]GIH76487.1 hypothetical protein Plo01_29160 [Planobispora longispora]